MSSQDAVCSMEFQSNCPVRIGPKNMESRLNPQPLVRRKHRVFVRLLGVVSPGLTLHCSLHPPNFGGRPQRFCTVRGFRALSLQKHAALQANEWDQIYLRGSAVLSVPPHSGTHFVRGVGGGARNRYRGVGWAMMCISRPKAALIRFYQHKRGVPPSAGTYFRSLVLLGSHIAPPSVWQD